jgi:hypothetical protein
MGQDTKKKGKNLKVVIFIGIIVIFGILIWMLDLVPAPAPVTQEQPAFVSIQVDDNTVGRLGEIKLKALIEPADLKLKKEKPISWSSSAGKIMAKAKTAVWTAPNDLGKHTISLKVLTDDNQELTSEVVVAVVSYEMPFEGDPAAAASTKELGMQNKEGYKIEEVWIEKESICLNEDFRVKVKASDPDGSNQWLTTRIHYAGTPNVFGNNVVMRPGAMVAADPETRKKEEAVVRVELYDFRQRQLKAVYTKKVKLKDCTKPEYGLSVSCKNTVNPLNFRCQLNDYNDPMFTASAFEWRILDLDDSDFPITTETPFWEYKFPFRPAARLADNFVVEVKAFGKDGQVRIGRGNLTLHHHMFLVRKQSGLLQLIVYYKGLEEVDGQVNLVVEMMNPHDDPIVLSEVKKIVTPCKKAPVPAGVVKPEDILGTDVLEPGKRHRFIFSMPVDRERCIAQLKFVGHGQDSGLPVLAWANMNTIPKMKHDRKISQGEFQNIMSAMRYNYMKTGQVNKRIDMLEVQQSQQQFEYYMKKFLKEEQEERGLDFSTMSKEEIRALEQSLRAKVFRHLRETGPLSEQEEPPAQAK